MENTDVSAADANTAQQPQGQQRPATSVWSIVKSILFRCLIFYAVVSFFKRGQTPTDTSTGGSTTTSSKTGERTTNLFELGQRFDLYAYVSIDRYFSDFENPSALFWSEKSLVYGDWESGPSGDGCYYKYGAVDVPHSVQNNGSIFLHVYAVKEGLSPNRFVYKNAKLADNIVYMRHQLNKFKKVKYVMTKNLLTGKTEKSNEEVEKAKSIRYEIKSFWHPNLTINIVVDHTAWIANAIPNPIHDYIEMVPQRNVYKPIVYANTFWNLLRDYSQLNETVDRVELSLVYQPVSLFKWQIFASQGSDKAKWTPEFMNALKSDDPDVDDEHDSLRETLLETSPYLLAITVVVTILHNVFELLAFKNEIQFWNNRDSLEGLSVRSVFFNAFQSLIVLLYILDNESNFLIKVTCFVGLGIDVWKIRKVVDVRLDYERLLLNAVPRLRFIDKSTYVESNTREYDNMAFRYLSWILGPLFFGYAIYSLIYDEHTSWYSFTLSLCYGFLLMFSFIMMTPQLFINYKMKSVAHLPWRMMTYKFLNTFIDDIFAFVVKMPTLHRLRCFRDDIVFFVFLYQRWIYKVDHSRVNEFGVSGDMLKKKSSDDEQQQLTKSVTDSASESDTQSNDKKTN